MREHCSEYQHVECTNLILITHGDFFGVCFQVKPPQRPAITRTSGDTVFD